MEQKLRRYIDRKFYIYPKTKEILELREELYSMMCDKYRDCKKSGLSKEKSYKKALTFMENYKKAIREVETGSSLGALKKKLVSSLLFSAVYFIALTCIYLYVSMFTVKSFETTWLIVVCGAFIYLIYFAASMLEYAKIFRMHILHRISLAALFLSFVPLIYVFPNLYLCIMKAQSLWSPTWLIVPVIAFLYVLTDLLVFGRKKRKLAWALELAAAGLVLTTAIYLFVSFIYNMWSIAWIAYVIYLGIVALGFYISEATKEK
ncbi:MAG: hypothetical protein RSD32_01565 [Oscillospiraceae bacterium]